MPGIQKMHQALRRDNGSYFLLATRRINDNADPRNSALRETRSVLVLETRSFVQLSSVLQDTQDSDRGSNGQWHPLRTISHALLRTEHGAGQVQYAAGSIMFMMMAMRHHVQIAIFLAATSLCADAQWLNNLDPKAPRNADGKVNMAGPVPRVGGKPDLSGVWQIDGGSPRTGTLRTRGIN
jgi:hypothetical protein